MMSPGPSAHIWIAAGHTDMRRGMHGLSTLIQTALSQSPFSGHVFVFRGRRGDLINILWFDGDGLCLFLKKGEWKGERRGERLGEGFGASPRTSNV